MPPHSGTKHLANLALNDCKGILEDEKAPARVRADVAIKILDRAGHVAPKAPGPVEPKEKKPISKMSVEELEDFIRRGKAAMEESGKPIIDGEVTA